MKADFAVKDLGDLNFFMGIKVSDTKDGITLFKQWLISMYPNGYKPITSYLSTFDGEIFLDPTLYQSTIGALQYLAIT